MTAAQRVAAAGLAIYGAEWVCQLARATGTHQRTMSRIKAAALAGRDYPAAKGVLLALRAVLRPVWTDLRGIRPTTAPRGKGEDQ